MTRRTSAKITDYNRYKVILSPVITEKATMVSAFNQYVFRVAPWASKPQVKAAVESLFNVKVEGVNTLNVKGKVKRFRGRPGQRPDVRKAIVRVAEGQTIDVAAGV